MKEKYEVKITKYVDGKPCEMLLGDVNSLNDLIENIDSFVERMKPITIDEETQKMVDDMFEDLKK